MPDSDERLEEYQRLYTNGLIDGVAVVAADANACDRCAALADALYLPSRLPRLPVADCEAVDGCRCRYEPSFTVYE